MNSDEKVAFCKQGLKDGLSAQKMAELIGDGTTRNAVLGIIHRRKLGPKDENGKLIKRSTRSKPKPKRSGNPNGGPGRNRAEFSTLKAPDRPVLPPQHFPDPVPVGPGIPFEDGRDGLCRFPMWTSADVVIKPEDRVICGAETEIGKHYCPTHHELTHKPYGAGLGDG